MDPMLKIPAGRKRIRTGRACLLMGVTVLLFVFIALGFGEAADIMRRMPQSL